MLPTWHRHPSSALLLTDSPRLGGGGNRAPFPSSSSAFPSIPTSPGTNPTQGREGEGRGTEGWRPRRSGTLCWGAPPAAAAGGMGAPEAGWPSTRKESPARKLTWGGMRNAADSSAAPPDCRLLLAAKTNAFLHPQNTEGKPRQRPQRECGPYTSV